jgi:hypothetical protein
MYTTRMFYIVCYFTYVELEVTFLHYLAEVSVLINFTKTQNYVKVKNVVWQQIDCMPMGLPTSSILAKIFLHEI